MRTIEFNRLKSRLVVASELSGNFTRLHTYYVVKHILFSDKEQLFIPVNEWSFITDTPVTCVSQSPDGNLVALLMEGCVLVYSIEGDQKTVKQVLIHISIDE